MSKLDRRRFLGDSLLAAAAATALPSIGSGEAATRRPARSRSAPLRVGVIGVRGRGRAHVGAFKNSPDSQVVAICDPDEGVIGLAMKAVPEARYHRDVRAMLDDESIDAVSIATPNHWHSLAAVWALQAGKHVYVEKPVSHNVREGRAVVEAAKKYGKIVQHGTQARSTQATRGAMEWLRSGGLGAVRVARALCYKRRTSIGHVSAPVEPPPSCDYDLWTGPAEMRPLMRANLHYDWHWDFETGNGDIGNQGVHQMDIARWGLGRDSLPERIVAWGGRLGYADDGNTPNTQIALLDYGDQQIVFEVRGLETSAYRGAKIGVVFHCEKGYLVSSSYGKVLAYNHDGEVVKTFQGGGDHFQDFLDAVKSGRDGGQSAPALDGHLSAALCHLGNVSYRLGEPRELGELDAPFGEVEAANEAIERSRDHLAENGVDLAAVPTRLGPTLRFDPISERFEGQHAVEANAHLTRPYRGPFVVPESV